MKKLLIMAPLFYPQKNGGGPTVSVMNLVKCIKGEFDIYVISNNYEHGQTKPLEGVNPGWNTYDFGKVYYFDYGQNTIKNVYKIICEIKPDVIYQNSFFSYRTALATLIYNKYHNIKTIVAPRGELCENAFAMKAFKKRIYFSITKLFGLHKNIYIHATGKEEFNSIRRIINKEDRWFYNISNITMVENNSFVSLRKDKGELSIIFAARIHRIKNLLRVIKTLKFVTGKVCFDVFGPIEDREYWEECQKEIETLPENIIVNYCGQVDQQNVSDKIKEHHVFFMPSSSENHGHSIVESLMSYRPVIISDNTPWQNLEQYQCGFSLDLDDEQGFVNAVQRYIDMENVEYENECKNARNYIEQALNIDHMRKEYISMLGE